MLYQNARVSGVPAAVKVEVHGQDLEALGVVKEAALDLTTFLVVVLSICGEEAARTVLLPPPRIPLLGGLVQEVEVAFEAQPKEVVALALVLGVVTGLLQDMPYACMDHTLRRLLLDPYSFGLERAVELLGESRHSSYLAVPGLEVVAEQLGARIRLMG